MDKPKIDERVTSLEEAIVTPSDTFSIDNNGLVPAPTQADINALKVLKANGAWDTILNILGFTPANNSNTVHTTGAETISGAKTFTAMPKVKGDNVPVRVTNASENATVDLISNSGKQRGLYDRTAGKWIVLTQANNDVEVNGSAVKLKTARSLYTNLGSKYNSSSPVTFDGTANKAIPVTGTLPVANGGTGKTSLADISVGKATIVTGVQIMSGKGSKTGSYYYLKAPSSGATWWICGQYTIASENSEGAVTYQTKTVNGTYKANADINKSLYQNQWTWGIAIRKS